MRRLARVLFAAPLLVGLSTAAARAADPPRRFLLFFTEWSAAMDKPAEAIVQQAADWIRRHDGATATVTGTADLAGSAPANQLLSRLRARVVADLLVQDGVAPQRVHLIGLGSVDYALTPQESRRVVITVTAP